MRSFGRADLFEGQFAAAFPSARAPDRSIIWTASRHIPPPLAGGGEGEGFARRHPSPKVPLRFARGTFCPSRKWRGKSHRATKGSRTRMVSSRSGLVESSATGAPINSSTRLIYLIAVAGSSAQERAPRVDPLHPSNVS